MKKLIALLAAFTMAAGAFANVDSLKGILSAQDDYMGVNDWEGVDPKTLFTTVDWSSSFYELNVGFAKYFGGLYAALSYVGPTWEFGTLNSNTDKNTSDNSWAKTTTTSGRYNTHNVYMLFGFANVGIQPYFSFEASSSDSSTTTENSSNTKTTSEKVYDKWTYGVNAGINLSDVLNVWFGFKGFTDLGDENSTSSNGDYSYSTNRTTDLTFNAGAWYLLSDGKFKQSVKGDVAFLVRAYPQYSKKLKTGSTVSVTANVDESYLNFMFTPDYKFEVNPVKNVYFSAEAYGVLLLAPESSSSTRSSFTVDFAPEIDLNLNVAIRPELVMFVTWENTIPEIAFATEKTEGTNTVKTENTFATGAYSSTLSTGFGWYFNKDTALKLSLNLFNTDNSVTINNILDDSFTISCAMQF